MVLPYHTHWILCLWLERKCSRTLDRTNSRDRADRLGLPLHHRKSAIIKDLRDDCSTYTVQQMPAQIYLVNAFGAQGAASALAANTVLRSLFGTFLPLAGPSLYSALGLGWGNSLLGFLAVVFTPVPFLFYRYGEWMRERWVMKV